MTATGGNALMQAVSLILIARNLGPSEYAAIVAATTCAAVAAEFVGLGSGDLLIREVSRDRQVHHMAFGRALALIGFTIAPFCLVATLAAQFWFDTPASLTILFALVISEIVAIRFAWLAEQIAIAHHAIHTATFSRLFASLVRFGAVLIAVFLAKATTAAEWSPFAVISSAILAVGCLGISIRRFGSPVFGHRSGSDTRVGFLFSVMQVIRALQFSIDKFAVGSVAAGATVGMYGAGSRVAQLGIMPASAVTRMTYPTFFATGAKGIDPAMRLAGRIAPAVLGLGLLSSAALAGIAYLLPFLLGPEFASTTQFVLALSPLPLASAIQNLGGNILSGSDYQAHRTWGMIAGVLLTAATCFAGAQLSGVEGAVVGYVIGHYLAAGCIWAPIFSLWSGERRHSR